MGKSIKIAFLILLILNSCKINSFVRNNGESILNSSACRFGNLICNQTTETEIRELFGRYSSLKESSIHVNYFDMPNELYHHHWRKYDNFGLEFFLVQRTYKSKDFLLNRIIFHKNYPWNIDSVQIGSTIFSELVEMKGNTDWFKSSIENNRATIFKEYGCFEFHSIEVDARILENEKGKFLDSLFLNLPIDKVVLKENEGIST